ncbi:MAG: ABC transporter permease [Phycisphaerae bacterium]|nr:ABC transporter permease [Phycisphaerae bacterium]
MRDSKLKTALSRLTSDYGMLLVLLLLCVYYSWVTRAKQHPTGVDAGEQLAAEILAQQGPSESVIIVSRDNEEDLAFADTLEHRLKAAGVTVVATVKGQPADARRALSEAAASGTRVGIIACNQATAEWTVFDDLAGKFPSLTGAKLVMPRSYRWPNFLKTDNLLNVANQIVVIAILAIGMTMVIITGGIDLSVGSLIALSACVVALLIREAAGAEHATALGMVLCCLGGVAVCGVVGLFSGMMVTLFAIPPFIVTLAMMLVASGLAFILAEGQSVYQVPDTFIWLGRGADAFGIPNAVVMMAVLYIAAHVLMTQTSLGRYIYAVGGNREAARLSGVPVRRVLLFVYAVCGALAGLGGVVTASQLKSGSPTYGLMYELYVIAAVVVGGTSLSGGEGKILGTLIGAFIIAVIQNGMNLTGVESYTQKVVLGLVILGAVLLDMLKKQGWDLFRRRRLS